MCTAKFSSGAQKTLRVTLLHLRFMLCISLGTDLEPSKFLVIEDVAFMMLLFMTLKVHATLYMVILLKCELNHMA